MRSHLRGLILVAGILIMVLAVLFMANQTAGVVSLATDIHPVLGKSVLYFLLALYTVIILVPIIIFCTMPRIINPPEDTGSKEYAAYLSRVRRHLAKNRRLKDMSTDLDDHSFTNAALVRLNSEADAIITSTATTVFITTAVSQNGFLDGVMVLTSLARLVWNIAHVYIQRPSIRDLFYVYVNVAATTFLVVNIEDMDIDEQVETIITHVIGSSFLGSIPGASGLSTVLTTSIINGSVNSLLTLRVGIIARSCFSFRRLSRHQAKRAASIEAARMFGGVFMKASGIVTDAVVRAYRKHISLLGRSAADTAMKSAETIAGAMSRAGTAIRDLMRSKTTPGSVREEPPDS